MKALTLAEPGRVEYQDVADPEILDSTDVLLRVTHSAICGSDLHAYHGRIQGIEPGVPIGHEYVGIVDALGKDVHNVALGDRVTGSFFVACGHCWACRRGYFSQCAVVALFGFGRRLGGLAGTQAERVRVPHADTTLIKLPDNVPSETGLLVGDILSTAYFVVDRAQVRPGDSVCVVGAGPVGLLCVEMAFIFGAAEVFSVDLVASRLQQAEALGARPIIGGADAARQIRRMTQGRGADAVIEAVGSAEALKVAMQAARGFATVSAAGVYTESALPISMGRAFSQDLTIRAGMANVPAVFGAVMALLSQGRLHPEHIFSHQLPLADGAQGYHLFDQHQATKVVLTVGP
ncbi:alcohol dehydrogenase catalytic domain-containing protein [Sulfobacillus harzensis]|uniref:Alcohol dehydrogenase catalytic domain-containing protein n=1 Tax=Sulfobacillus harzensis TaxID=2729629 RepID=A0A7Y0Q0D5_9FIRM|nr:alcohol dehydrogenase catalytic domain-containing protein [Sulfobacillus harzensis]NMP20898.1 alcohol dehydrogenase catalytic domain-containing protein [Sulfobacillus harzensis]